MVAGGGQPEALGEVEATERSWGEKMMPESRAVAVMSMSYLKIIREEHQWDLMLGWLWGGREGSCGQLRHFGLQQLEALRLEVLFHPDGRRMVSGVYQMLGRRAPSWRRLVVS